VVVCVAQIVVSLGVTALSGLSLIASRREASAQQKLQAVDRALVGAGLRTAIYYGGAEEDVYQLNVWIDALERLPEPTLVLIRNPAAVPGLAKTRLPVLLVPGAVELMALEFSMLKVVFYVANVGNNIHMLRLPHLTSVFLGHGDSDKSASANPFAKVYDEIWVAGRVARERYVRADVGVRGEDIVEVGRPQLEDIAVGPRADRLITGESVVGSPAVGAGTTVSEATASEPASTPGSQGTAEAGAKGAFEVAALDHGPRAFTVLYAPSWEGWVEDPVASSLVPMGLGLVKVLLTCPGVRVVYKPHPLTGHRSAQAAKVHQQIVDLLITREDDHAVVLGRTPTLLECFNTSDALISDVSSVVSDFIQSEKPYFICNPANLGRDVFIGRYPSSAAAYLVDRSLNDLVASVAMAASGQDVLAADRLALKYELLGPSEPGPQARFAREVGRIVAGRPSHAPAPSGAASTAGVLG